MLIRAIVGGLLGVWLMTWSVACNAQSVFVPVRLQAGHNVVKDIAGDGKEGSISLFWRENGNAWGYDIFTVVVGGSVASSPEGDHFLDQPFTGEFSIKSVRFARSNYRGRFTLFALVANRKTEDGLTSPSETKLVQYALVENLDGTGTPYKFVTVGEKLSLRKYCNAEMALKTEFGLPLSKSYTGSATVDGC